ncbi:MAG: right-handed parallel beta-helix repeat-containing protein [Candidatus Zixiibacteriota bacterium]
MKFVIILIWALWLLFYLFGSLSATVIHVPDDQPTIQAGINAASNGDTVLVADGTYTGAGNRDIDFLGKAIVLKSENGPMFTAIDCQGSPGSPQRGLFFHSAEDSTTIIEGIKIINGCSPEYEIEDQIYAGGAMLCINNSSPLLINCIFENNTARGPEFSGYFCAGGAIGCFDKSSPIFIGTDFFDNIVFTDDGIVAGGAIFIDDSSNLCCKNCNFISNKATENDSITGIAYGGAIYAQRSNIIIENCMFESNSVEFSYQGIIHDNFGYGGAITLVGADSLICNNCKFESSSIIDNPLNAGVELYSPLTQYQANIVGAFL